MGEPGKEGPKGDTGETGSTGEIGEKGEQGDKGDTGTIGATGPPGIQREKGQAGQQGPKGETGIPGIGIQGDQGPPGILPSSILSAAINDQLSADTTGISGPMLYIFMAISVLSITITIFVVIAGLVWIIKHKGNIKTNSDIELSSSNKTLSNDASNIAYGIENNKCYGVRVQQQTDEPAESCYDDTMTKLEDLTGKEDKIYF